MRSSDTVREDQVKHNSIMYQKKKKEKARILWLMEDCVCWCLLSLLP